MNKLIVFEGEWSAVMQKVTLLFSQRILLALTFNIFLLETFQVINPVKLIKKILLQMF